MIFHIAFKWLEHNMEFVLSISRPNGRAAGCLVWGFFLENQARYNDTALYFPSAVIL